VAKKYQKSQRQPRRAPVRKKAVLLILLHFIAQKVQNRRYKPTFFALQKSYCPRYARLVVFPRHTLVLAPHGENLAFQVGFYLKIAQA